MRLVLLAALSAAASLPLTAAVRALAHRRDVLDHPNDRSSHTVATPRGGGLAFLLVIVVGALVATSGELDGGRLALALLVGGLPVAGVGLLDDLRGLSAAARAAVHTASAAVAVAVLGVPTGSSTPVRAVVFLGYVVALVWLVNLYNFMDGIDGIAGGQAVAASLGLVLLLGSGGPVAGVAAVVAGAVAGFLVLNRPPASIFMGDVGSGFLGMVLGLLGIAAHRSGGVPLGLLLLLVAPFLVDASATLAVRVVRGERWYEPHRDHVYQRLVLRGATHGQVTAGYVLLALLLAAAARLLLHRGFADLVAAATGLLLLAAWAVARARTSPP